MGNNSYENLPSTSYAQKGKDAVLSPRNNGQLALGEITIENASGGAVDVGIGYKVADGRWKAGQYVDATTTYTDDTTDAQDSDTNDFALTTLTNNDGFIVQSFEKFNLLGLTKTTAGNGASTLEYNYWNGSAWVALTTKETLGDLTGTGDVFLAFLAPHDWAKSSASAATGIDTNMYALRVRATTAPVTTAALASLLWIGVLPFFKESLANNTQFSVDRETDPIIFPGGAGLLPYFGGTANANNMVSARYRTIGEAPA